MRPRHPLPRRWMMTDERLGDVAAKVAKLPRGSGVVFRQYATPEGKRRRMFAQVRRIARARRLTLLIAGPFLPGADGVHGKKARKNNGLATRPVHSVRERIAAERAGVDATFVSPVFATRSHPGARPLGRIRFAMLIRGARLPVIALGGMTERRARTLPGIAGWAAIDAWSAPRPTAERS